VRVISPVCDGRGPGLPRHVAAVLARALACCLAAVAPAAAQKTDIVELINGDRITCEIQKMDRGKLTAKTDGLGTLSIEWNDVVRVTSIAFYDVELQSGTRLTGSIVRGDAYTMLLVIGLTKEKLELGRIVRLTRLGRTFWRRWDGSIAGGFTFAQADAQTQSTFDFHASYRNPKWLTQLTYNSLLTSREDVDSQSRNDVMMAVQRFMRPRWSYMALGSFQQNEELALTLRSIVGGGVVRVLRQSDRMLLQTQLGLVYTSELYEGESEDSIAETVAGVGWDWFTFDGRSTNLDSSVLTFFALRNDTRFRLELNTSFKSDIVGDLYWSVSLVESFNSDPPQGRKKSDLSVSATIGWTF
jgi:putative salt-induced outer membrane protein YdiY